jgi:hypothetical protein
MSIFFIVQTRAFVNDKSAPVNLRLGSILCPPSPAILDLPHLVWHKPEGSAPEGEKHHCDNNLHASVVVFSKRYASENFEKIIKIIEALCGRALGSRQIFDWIREMMSPCCCRAGESTVCTRFCGR